jgi:DNA/RNA endonuclease G (NUC1)
MEQYNRQQAKQKAGKRIVFLGELFKKKPHKEYHSPSSYFFVV